MTDLKALVFDVDGTLADTERDGHRVAFNQAFAEAGLDWEWTVELYAELLSVTGGKERIGYYIERYRPAFPAPRNPDEFIVNLHWRKTHFYTHALSQGAIPLRPGVARLLSEAREAGMQLAIATTTTPQNVTALLSATLGPASIGWFKVIAAGDVVPAKKPAPDIYHYAMQQMDLKPAECAALEDSAHGARSALDAEIPTLVVTVNDYTRDQDFSGASLIVDGFGEPHAHSEALSPATDFQGYVDLGLIRHLHRG